MAPPIHGTTDPAFAAVRDALAVCFDEHGELGAAVHVAVEGRPVVDLWAGDARPGKPWRSDTLVNVYSVGKAVAATLALRLVADGRLDLDQTVASVWPAFGAHAKDDFTVREALSHRAAVPAIAERMVDADLADFDRMAAAVAATPPWWERGAGHVYHTNTYGHLVGGIVRALSGDLPDAALRSAVPGIDFHYGVADTDLARCADIVWDGPSLTMSPDELDALDGEFGMTMRSYANPPGYSSMRIANTTLWRQAMLPSTNGHASARGVADFYERLRTGLLPDALLAEAATPQSSGWCPALGQDVTFGLGFQPWTEHRPVGRTPGSLGHFGTGGALGFLDPTHGIAFGYVMNHVIPRWQSPRNRILVDAVYDSL